MCHSNYRVTQLRWLLRPGIHITSSSTLARLDTQLGQYITALWFVPNLIRNTTQGLASRYHLTNQHNGTDVPFGSVIFFRMLLEIG